MRVVRKQCFRLVFQLLDELQEGGKERTGANQAAGLVLVGRDHVIPGFLLHPASAAQSRASRRSSIPARSKSSKWAYFFKCQTIFITPKKKIIIKAAGRKFISFLSSCFFRPSFILEGKGSAVFLLEYGARLSGFSFTAALYDQEAARSIFYESVRR